MLCTAIGWSLTGTMNSPSTNVAVMYTSENNESRNAKTAPTKLPLASTQPSIASLISESPVKFKPHQPLTSPSSFAHFDPVSMPPPPNQAYNGVTTPDPALVSDADLLLNLHSPFATSSPPATRLSTQNPTSYTRTTPSTSNLHTQPQKTSNEFSPTMGSMSTSSDNAFGDMFIDTQDVDMSVLGADMMPWDLEYLPHDMLYFNDGNFGPSGFGNDDAPNDHSAG